MADDHKVDIEGGLLGTKTDLAVAEESWDATPRPDDGDSYALDPKQRELVEFVQGEQRVAKVESEDRVASLMRQFRKLKDEKDVLDEQYKIMQRSLNAVKEELNVLFQARQLTNLSMTDVGTAYTSTMTFATVLDWEKFLAWLDELGEGEMAERQVHSAKLRSWVQDRISRGLEVPEEIVKLTFKTDIRLRKG